MTSPSTGGTALPAAPGRLCSRRDGDLLQLVLSAPERGNIIDLDFTNRLAAATADLDRVRCILLTAEGPNFCLGGDVAAFSTAADPGAYIDDLARDLHETLVRLDDAGVPIVVGVQGWAAGAGLSLVLAADIVVLERAARMRAAYSAIGLSPDGGMSWSLPRAIGSAQAMDMLLTNRPMNAAQALAAGLASRVVEDGSAAQVALDIASGIASGPRRALSAARTLVRDGRDRSYPAHMDAERASISAQAGGPEGREGVAAFLGRRPPEWPD